VKAAEREDVNLLVRLLSERGPMSWPRVAVVLPFEIGRSLAALRRAEAEELLTSSWAPCSMTPSGSARTFTATQAGHDAAQVPW